MRWAADFETTTDENDCRVWAYGIIEVGAEPTRFHYGNSIDGFFNMIRKKGGDVFYFRNLKFDGEFIIWWLLKNGFTHVKGDPGIKLKPMEFSTLISDKGVFYQIKIQFEDYSGKMKPVTILDSLKIIPLSIEKTAKAFGLPVRKSTIDYNEDRPPGHELTGEELFYLRMDVEIDARSLHQMFSQNLNKMTQGANALHDYKQIIGKKTFERKFPVLDYLIEQDIRQAYKGGFTYLKRGWEEKDVGEGIVFDVNSLYPSVMYFNKLPWGEPLAFKGKYEEDKQYDLFIQRFTCRFKLKEGFLPTIQLKNNLSFIPTEYVESSGEEDVTLVLTSVDMVLFFKHYDVDLENIDWEGGWKFRSSNAMFKSYVDKWMDVKERASVEENSGLRTIAKLMMNALYGKFGLNPNVRSKYPYLDDDVVKYANGPKETRDPIYIPLACFVTAWARHKTISAAQSVYDRFLYADTDSLHLMGTDVPDSLEVHPTHLGFWKHESTFARARFIRTKSYVEDEYHNSFIMPELGLKGPTKFKITCAGMPPRCYPGVTWSTFYTGNSFSGKLRHKHVKGGVVLKPTSFTIKE